MSNFALIGMLAGGVGIFLLAVGMLTDGLKLAAGAGLRSMLGNWTRTPVHGVFTGFCITAIVQSSSAITVATIGFVNAGLLNLSQALGVVYGANIGTTLTGWLVAIIGFDINISALALPIIGVGMLLRLTGGETRRAAVGTALVGFGLFFIGIDTLKQAFEGVVATLDMERYQLEGIGGLLFYLALGFLMTVLTQSSSAAIAITLTAASGGLLGIYAAGAMVIGANLGTTSTAVISVIGATANAKRVAGAHVIFNGVTGIVALLLLPLMFVVVNAIASLLNIESEPAVSLALFHTVFNTLGVLLMLPFSARLAAILNSRFTTKEEILGTPQYLDKNVVKTPALALNALVLETIHLAELVRGLSSDALQSSIGSSKEVKVKHDAIVKLVQAIGDFIMDLQRGEMQLEVAETLPRILRCTQYYLTAAELAIELVEHKVEGSGDTDIQTMDADFHAEVLDFIDSMNVTATDFSLLEHKRKTEVLKAHYDTQKENKLRHSITARLPVSHVARILDADSNARRMATQLAKATSVLDSLHGLVNAEAQERQEQDTLHEEIVGD